MFVLDTNHVSELTYRTAAGLRLLQLLDAADQDAAVSAITVEFASWRVLPWDDDAADRFDSLKSLRQQVGTQDLKIASICLAHDATLLTRNLANFKPVPGPRVENWRD